MAEYVKLARRDGGQWGVSIRNPPGGCVGERDINALISQIALTAHVAEGRNGEEWAREVNRHRGAATGPTRA